MNDRESRFEALRAEKLRDRDDLLRTARDYARRNLFSGQARNTVTSIIGKHDAHGAIAMTERMWSALAGCVAYVEAEDADGDGADE